MTANEIAAGIGVGVGVSAVLWVVLSIAVWRIEAWRVRRTTTARSGVPVVRP